MRNKYIDANIFIQAILRNDESCIQILQKIIKKELFGVTSVLSWDELVYIIKKFVSKDVAVMEGKKFLQFPNLIFIDTKKEIILKAQKLIEKYNIKPRDAIHAATAIHVNADEIVSEDNDFDVIEELKRVGSKNV